MARTSKSEATGIGFSTMGSLSAPGMISCSPAFKNSPLRLPLVSRMAWESSAEVRYEVRDRYVRETALRLSPRLAVWTRVPGWAATLGGVVDPASDGAAALA